jgi:acetylornithine aminotransferase
MLECVQGEGGVWPLDDAYLQSVRSLTEAQGLLLIIDEVQTGFFRTGEAFSFMHAGIRPDVVTLAKGIANGFPCGAVAATGIAGDILVPGEHGSTFGGNPLAVAAARATLSELTRMDAGKAATEAGVYFKTQLALLPHVQEVRGKGLMIGVSLDVDLAPQVGDEALAQGMVINTIGTTILRFLPPLSVSRAEIDALMTVLTTILEKL